MGRRASDAQGGRGRDDRDPRTHPHRELHRPRCLHPQGVPRRVARSCRADASDHDVAELRADASSLGNPARWSDQAGRSHADAPAATAGRPAQERQSGRVGVVPPVGRKLSPGSEEGPERRGEVGAAGAQPDDVRRRASGDRCVTPDVGARRRRRRSSMSSRTTS